MTNTQRSFSREGRWIGALGLYQGCFGPCIVGDAMTLSYSSDGEELASKLRVRTNGIAVKENRDETAITNGRQISPYGQIQEKVCADEDAVERAQGNRLEARKKMKDQYHDGHTRADDSYIWTAYDGPIGGANAIPNNDAFDPFYYESHETNYGSSYGKGSRKNSIAKKISNRMRRRGNKKKRSQGKEKNDIHPSEYDYMYDRQSHSRNTSKSGERKMAENGGGGGRHRGRDSDWHLRTNNIDSMNIDGIMRSKSHGTRRNSLRPRTNETEKKEDLSLIGRSLYLKTSSSGKEDDWESRSSLKKGFACGFLENGNLYCGMVKRCSDTHAFRCNDASFFLEDEWEEVVPMPSQRGNELYAV